MTDSNSMQDSCKLIRPRIIPLLDPNPDLELGLFFWHFAIPIPILKPLSLIHIWYWENSPFP